MQRCPSQGATLFCSSRVNFLTSTSNKYAEVTFRVEACFGQASHQFCWDDPYPDHDIVLRGISLLVSTTPSFHDKL